MLNVDFSTAIEMVQVVQHAFEPVGGHPQPKARPWKKYEGEFFPYVEMTLDRRITTVVGANESGKSHLLSALSKEFRGHGNADDADQLYAMQDICRYCAFEELEKNVWPSLGIELTFETADEQATFFKTAEIGSAATNPKPNSSSHRCTIIVDGAKPKAQFASVYNEADSHFNDLSRDKWFQICGDVLPNYQYIDARIALSETTEENTGSRDVGCSWFLRRAKAAACRFRKIVGTRTRHFSARFSGSRPCHRKTKPPPHHLPRK
jgi:hypothetical protein